MYAMMNMGARVAWFDKSDLGDVKAKDHQKFSHITNLQREHIEDSQRQLNTLVDELKLAEVQMVDQDMNPFASGDYLARLFCGSS